MSVLICPTPGCNYEAGTACTMQGCPGRTNKRAAPRRAGLGSPSQAKPHTNTAPRSSQQPTLASGCEGHPAACDKRRGDKRTHTLRKDGNGETFCIDLPLPPSANALTVNLKNGGRAKSAVYKAWIEEARWHVMMAWRGASKPEWPADCPMSIRIEAGIEGRKRDVGNIEKAISDLLVKNLPIPDDRWFDRILIERREDIPGIARVTIAALEQGGEGQP